MTETPNLGLALIAESQTQKHIAANEAFARIDAVTQLSVESRAATAPPASPSEGACWLIPAGASDAFADHDGEIAAFDNGGWIFLTPKAGWRAWVVDEADLMIYDGADWISTSGPDLSTLTELGVNATPDATNRLAVKSEAALFSHDDVTPGSGDVRLTMNKAAADKTAAMVWQTEWSARAELGLAGDDQFRVKVSPDGTTFYDAIVVDQATGVVTLPNTPEAIPETAPKFGVNATADSTNRLMVKSDAALLSHDDVTPGSGDVRLNLNKSETANTASVTFQSDWTGRAEMGLTGDDAFAVKVSDSGGEWREALRVDPDTGAVTFPNTDLSSVPAGGAPGQVLAKSSATDGDIAWVDASGSEFGDSPPVNTDYINARGLDLISNGAGLLGNNYNYPDNFTYDPVTTPNLPAAFSYAGYFPNVRYMEEFIPVDPNRIYRLSTYLRQEALPGDWSASANGDRHTQYMGLAAYDADGASIGAQHHMRYIKGGVDSLTTLAAPLTPGDTQISVTNASGWNDSETASYRRGIIIFGYSNSLGGTYDYYSRFFKFNLFDLSGVNKTTGVITLNQALPASLGNSNDPNGTWPAGTRIANSNSGGTFKYSILPGYVLAASGTWFSATNYMGGIDRSGTNVTSNFPPGTALVKPFWLPNYSNRSGGYSIYPDTGANHRVWFTGVSVTPDPYASLTANANGSQAIKVPTADPNTGVLSLQTAGLKVEEV